MDRMDDPETTRADGPGPQTDPENGLGDRAVEHTALALLARQDVLLLDLFAQITEVRGASVEERLPNTESWPSS